MSEFKTFQIEKISGVTHVSFNRPEKANAVNDTGWREMKQIFEMLSEDSETRVIILKGAGKNFCAGIDLTLLMNIQEFRQIKDEARQRLLFRKFLKAMQGSINAIEQCQKPVIAAIQGACIGAGVDIISACDLRYCSSNAFFSIKEIDMGLVADLGTFQRLPKFMNFSHVAEMAYTGRNVSGEEAESLGLVNKCAGSEEDLMAHATSVAKSISEKSPLVLKGIKQNLLYSRDHSVSDSLEYVATWNTGLIFSTDLLEAFQASMEKRKAEFENL